MARALRCEYKGEGYHVTGRESERRNIFRRDKDRKHFLGLVGELDLNPVRTRTQGLDKVARSPERDGVEVKRSRESVTESLPALKAFRWSSFRAYSGAERSPDWVQAEEALAGFGRGALGGENIGSMWRSFSRQVSRVAVLRLAGSSCWKWSVKKCREHVWSNSAPGRCNARASWNKTRRP
jgi:hypothetical protein